MVNHASTPSERSHYPHTEMLKDELVAGLALVDGLHQLRPKRQWVQDGRPFVCRDHQTTQEEWPDASRDRLAGVDVHDLRYDG